MRIPGISLLTEGEESLLPTLFLLEGPLGVGKRQYCTQFLEDGVTNNAPCILISARLTDNQFKDLFYKVDKNVLKKQFKFINPLLAAADIDAPSPLNFIYQETISFLNLDKQKKKKDNRWLAGEEASEEKDKEKDKEGESESESENESRSNEKMTYVVVDSLNQLCDIFDVDVVRKFLARLTIMLKKIGAIAIFTIDTPVIEKYVPVTSFCEGKLEMAFEEVKGGSLSRKIRLISSSHAVSSPKWTVFSIDDKGSLTFGDNFLTCTMDSKPIQGVPLYYMDSPFCSEECIKTYKKVSPFFPTISPKLGLLDYHFFFIDIVGLSDPHLVVEKQKQKIERLNGFIKECEAFRKTPDDLKIILPTGDGMAIGFKDNPELPYRLSAELHKHLKKYNKRKAPDDMIDVRIGLSSGPVFTVSDISDNPNVWGPGIILARRVMDLGDSWHIMIAENLANQLKPLTEEYRKNIREMGNYEIKHGEKIKVFCTYSEDYGNPETPEKFKK
jgi:archaellum biogenesis ATPase FlaH